MANPNRNRKNQPPTGVGKNQSRRTAAKIDKRSVVGQAAPHRPEQNLASSAEEESGRSHSRGVRPKAGR
jgi:hypothetical protein